MKKILGILVLSLILFNTPLSAKQTKWKIGKFYEDEVVWVKNTKHLLPAGEKFQLVLMDLWRSWGIEIAGKWLISTKGNVYHQSLSLDRIGSQKYLAYLKIFYEEIFFKNKYDGCYQRSEYTVMERRKQGGFFNCFLVRHIDIHKLLFAPDDPQRTTTKQKYVINKYNLEITRILLCSYTFFYVPTISETVLSLEFCMNPETNGGPKSKYTSEEASEYHPQNIDKYPEHKKFMEKFIKIAAKRHKYFENQIRAKERHKLDLTMFGVGEITEATKTISTNGNISVEIKELYELYKEGVLTKEEFEKGKEKLLN